MFAMFQRLDHRVVRDHPFQESIGGVARGVGHLACAVARRDEDFRCGVRGDEDDVVSLFVNCRVLTLLFVVLLSLLFVNFMLSFELLLCMLEVLFALFFFAFLLELVLALMLFFAFFFGGRHC